MIIQMSGVPGSGKSTLAHLFAKEINAVIIDHDVIKSPMVTSDFTIDNRVTPQEIGKLTYDIDFALADYYLSQDRNVIIDSPCAYDVILEKGIELAEKHKTGYKYIECVLQDRNELDNRLIARKKLPSQVLQGVPLAHSSDDGYNKWINGMKRPDENYLVVETNMPLKTYLPQVLEYINS